MAGEGRGRYYHKEAGAAVTFRAAIVVMLMGLIITFTLPVHAFWGQSPPAHQPDYYTVTTTAGFRPVAVPGTQRRVAQNDAEEQARKLIYEYVGSMPVAGGRTVNDVLARDARVKARVLEYIRTAELVDWAVNPRCACVQVWMRVDLHQVRALLASCTLQ